MDNTGYVFLIYTLGWVSSSNAGGMEVGRTGELSDNALHVSWPFFFCGWRAAVCQEESWLGVMKTLLCRKVHQRRTDCVRGQIGKLWLNALICEFDAIAGASAHVIIRLQLGPVSLHHVKYRLEPFKVAHGVCHALYLGHKRKARSCCCCPHVSSSMYSAAFECSLFNLSDKLNNDLLKICDYPFFFPLKLSIFGK